MQISKHLAFLFISLFISGSTYSQMNQDSIASYIKSIGDYRNGKNIKMLYTESTPLKPEQQKSFEGLKYFPPDINYVVEGQLIQEEEQEIVVMKTSTERAPEYIRFGTITFELQGKKLTLTAYQSKKLVEVNPRETSLFIPFRDGTSGQETYGGGRYVDCEIPTEGNTVLLDFNKAYNPYCAYNPRYSCVIPPEENRLEIRIEAGEKVFEEH